jgi:GMP synthase-like glutamine amidotransferase
MKIKVALLDMYNNKVNLGISGIQALVAQFDELELTTYNVRANCEVPGLDYDIYISTGGPGSPLDGDGIWDRTYYYMLEKIWKHNQISDQKKYMFFICHSFQLACIFLSLGTIIKRRKPSLGVFPVHLTKAGKTESQFQGLSDPFYAADFRKWQVIRPYKARIKRLGCEILAMEKIRPHVALDRAIMAMRFSPEWIGTQFHPEAKPSGMIQHFNKADEKEEILKHKGLKKYNRMIEFAEDPSKLKVTHDVILPSFMIDSIKKIKAQSKVISAE